MRSPPQQPHSSSSSVTLDWSYDLLSEAERRLSMFSGFTLDAAEAVGLSGGATAAALGVHDLLGSLERLVAHSLVVPAPDPSGAPRYRMLERIGRYARTSAMPAENAWPYGRRLVGTG